MGLNLHRSLHIVSILGVIGGAICAIATSAAWYLTLTSIDSVKCVGRSVIQGYRSAPSDLIAQPVFALFILAMLVMVSNSQRTIAFIEAHDATVFGVLSLRLSFGMLLVCLIVLGLVLLDGLLVVESMNRYWQISRYCRSIILPS